METMAFEIRKETKSSYIMGGEEAITEIWKVCELYSEF